MTKPNPFVWYDAMTTDMKAAEPFYRTAVGWEINDSGMPGQTYSILSAGGAMVGGLMPIPDDARAMGVQPAWMGYIGVDDVDDYAKRVKAAGGSIMREPTDIPGVGRFAVAADPHGAGFYLFKPNTDQAPTQPPMGTAGQVGWRELHAGDGVAAFAFYSGLFGWTKDQTMDMGAMGVYQTFKTAGEQGGGMMTKAAEMPRPAWLYYFNVDGIDAAVKRVTDAGGKVINGPMPVPGDMWIIHALDPQGAMFGLLATKR
jgi:predicted enzyme related to lactoylglutathione lyase